MRSFVFPMTYFEMIVESKESNESRNFTKLSYEIPWKGRDGGAERGDITGADWERRGDGVVTEL